MDNKEIQLTLKSVYKQLGDFRLENINLEVFEKQIVGVIGENGAGKTTLLQIISKNEIVDSGSVDIPSKKQLGFVFDSNHLPNDLSANNLNHIFPYIFENWRSDSFFKYLQLFKIPIDLALKNFSKGMAMKINIAVALSHNPKFLLLDEITSGLDPLIRDEILSIIKEYVYDNSAIAIMTTHLLDDVIRIANRVVVLRNGAISLNKNVEEITDTQHLEHMLKDITVRK